MIRIRIDDVMIQTDAFSYEKSVRKFKSIQNWFSAVPEHIIHVPTILVKSIQEYPEVVEFIGEEIKENKIFPQIHGWEHIDYNELSEEEIFKALKNCIEWFEDTWNYQPTIWATPWGVEEFDCTQAARNAAKRNFLTIEGARTCLSPGRAVQLCESHNTARPLHGQTIMEHWWKRGLHLMRIAEVAKHGSYIGALDWNKNHRVKEEGWTLFD